MLRLIAIASLAIVAAIAGRPTPAPQDPRAWDAAPTPPLACTRVRRVRDEVGPRPTRNEPVREPRRSDRRPTERAPEPSEALDRRPAPATRPDVAVGPGDIAGVFIPRPDRPVVMVRHPGELVDSTSSPTFRGTLIIPADAEWDMTGRNLNLGSGVHLIGQRGELCSRPRLYTLNQYDKFAMITIRGDEVRVEGVHLEGPANGSRSSSLPGSGGIVIEIARVAGQPNPTGQRILIRDNELDEWPGSAIDVRARVLIGDSTVDVKNNHDWPEQVVRPLPSSVSLVKIENNYLHNNARNSLGYGTTVGTSAYATITGNVYDANRHAVASNGKAYSGYTAKFNYVLEGGYKEGSYYNQHFDVHGTGDGGYGGIAGFYYEIANNTIRGDQGYGVGKTRPALSLRGKSDSMTWFHDNVAVHEDLDDAVDLKYRSWSTGIGEHHSDFNFKASGNHFDTDRYDEFTTGDFDGDGRTDLLLTNGTGWFVSRGGREPWQFIHASDKRIGTLGVADINNDGVSDIVWRAPDGRLGYLAFGAGAVIWIGTSPVPANELRFGDFNGDGRTDLFYRGTTGEWNIMYAADGVWKAVGTSALELTNLVFGNFDDRKGTDIVGALAGYWGISSGAVTTWDTLGGRHRASFANATVADFDGNGRDDIAFLETKLVGTGALQRQSAIWQYSADGRAPLRKVRPDLSLPARARLHLRAGMFEGGQKAQLLTWANSTAEKWNYLVLWNGDPARGFVTYSRHAMK